MNTNNKLIQFIIIICFTIILGSCVSQISYDVRDEKNRIVINSLLTSKADIQKVIVKRSVLTGNISTTSSLPVTDAIISIKSTSQVFDFYHSGNGTYITSFAAIPGETYVLEVNVDGQKYISSPEKMPDVIPLLDVNTQLISKERLNNSGNLVNEKFVNINLTGTISSDFKCLYRVIGEYEFMEFNPPSTMLKTCYATENIDNNTIKLISAKDQRIDKVEKSAILEIPFDARFLRQYAFKVFQYNISESSLEYWKKINQISNTGSNLFDSPPGKIIGNIKNINDPTDEVLGNFTLGAVSDSIIFTNMAKLGGIVTDVCQVRFNTPRPDICINCLLIPFSTTIKPDYWP